MASNEKQIVVCTIRMIVTAKTARRETERYINSKIGKRRRYTYIEKCIEHIKIIRNSDINEK